MNGRVYAQLMESGEHPRWCARGHHCTAALGGHHASEQHLLRTDVGSVVVTRYQMGAGSNGTVEVRMLLGLPPVDEASKAVWITTVAEAVHATVAALSWTV